ncbi:hypothetical protein G6F43_002308 [Rhizopus delemar]|nr:hypothetical protein G6F43_002308 [Rhizopus delemar]
MPDDDPKMSCWLDHAKSSKLVWSKEVDGQGSDPGKGSLLVSSRATRSCTQPILCQARLAQETCVPFGFFFSCQQDHCKCSMGSAWPGIPTLPAVQMTIRLYASPQKENRYSFGYPVTS